MCVGINEYVVMCTSCTRSAVIMLLAVTVTLHAEKDATAIAKTISE